MTWLDFKMVPEFNFSIVFVNMQLDYFPLIISFS